MRVARALARVQSEGEASKGNDTMNTEYMLTHWELVACRLPLAALHPLCSVNGADGSANSELGLLGYRFRCSVYGVTATQLTPEKPQH